jgi:Asp-tRNA(Asn)/Glu-tRNA(Gln) amidotransferase A subunit family amidase
MNMPDAPVKLTELGVIEAMSLIGDRRLSASELTEALLQRIELTDKRLKAWAYVDARGARAEAVRLDRIVPLGPLHGIPVAIKDLIDVDSMPSTQGWAWPYSIPPIAGTDALVVRRLRTAGAVIMGKTVTTPFAGPDISITTNPWNIGRTPGGSSSGSAAAVASGQVPAALGTQTVGSVLRPAAYCGVVGFKPTFGALSTQGVFPMAWSLDHVGILTRSVADAGLIFDAISDASCGDRPEDREDPSWRPRIGVQADILALADEQTKINIASTLDICQSAGAEIIVVPPPEKLEHVLSVFGPMWLAELYAVHEEGFQRRAALYPPALRTMLELGSVISASTYLKTRRLMGPIRSSFAEVFGQYDALLSPVVPSTAPVRTTTGDYRFQATWSVLGVPAISIPSGWDDQHLPFAIQLASGHGQDQSLLRVARWIERLIPHTRGIATP